MRTAKASHPSERIIHKPELSARPHRQGLPATHNHPARDKTAQTPDRIPPAASRPGHRADPTFPGHEARTPPAEGQQIAPPGPTHGHDAPARTGRPRQERRDTYPETHQDLVPRTQISESHARHLYQQVYLPPPACHERQHEDRPAQAARQYGGPIIPPDSPAPEGGEPQPRPTREPLTGPSPRSGRPSRPDQATPEAFPQPPS